jgi:hypothetical protein
MLSKSGVDQSKCMVIEFKGQLDDIPYFLLYTFLSVTICVVQGDLYSLR